MSYNDHNKLATFRLNSSNYSLNLSPELNNILSLTDFTIEGEGLTAVKHYVSSRPVDLSSGIRRIFVYCSAVQESIVGDRFAPILRVITIDNKRAGAHTQTFTRPIYFPIKTNTISSLEFNLRTETGELLQSNYGHTCCVLHFKRNLF